MVGGDYTLLRLLPVSFGVASVPLIYLLGSYLYGRRAGLMAALCLALSPQHIWVSQEIRAYSLMIALIAVSLYTLLRAVRADGWGTPGFTARHAWGAFHLMANVLLLATHALTVLVLVVEGCFLLIFARPLLRPALAWMKCHAAILGIWACWMLQIPFSHDLPATPFKDVCPMLFAADTISGNRELLPYWRTHPLDVLPDYLRDFLSVAPVMDTALIVLSCFPLLLVLPLALALCRGVMRRWGILGSSDDGRNLLAAQNAVLLLLLFLLPGLTLALLALIMNKAFLTPMYVMYNSLAIYIAVGAGVNMIWPRGLRRLVVTGVAILYSYQLILFLPYTTRSDWKSAARHVSSYASPGDLLLEVEFVFPGEYIRSYLKDGGIDVRRVTTFQAACDDSAVFLAGAGAPGAAGTPPRHAWIIFETAFLGWLYPAFDVCKVIDEALAERGLQSKRVEFPGQYNPTVIEVFRNDAAVPKAVPKSLPTLTPIDYDALLRTLGVNPANQERHDRLVAALRSEVMVWPPYSTLFTVIHSLDLLKSDQPELAEAMACFGLARKPSLGLGHFAMGLAKAAQHHDVEAMAYFRTAFLEHPGLRALLAGYVSALCETKRNDVVIAEVEKLEAMRFLLTPVLREVCRLRFSSPQGTL